MNIWFRTNATQNAHLFLFFSVDSFVARLLPNKTFWRVYDSLLAAICALILVSSFPLSLLLLSMFVKPIRCFCCDRTRNGHGKSVANALGYWYFCGQRHDLIFGFLSRRKKAQRFSYGFNGDRRTAFVSVTFFFHIITNQFCMCANERNSLNINQSKLMMIFRASAIQTIVAEWKMTL